MCFSLSGGVFVRGSAATMPWGDEHPVASRNIAKERSVAPEAAAASRPGRKVVGGHS